MTAYHRIGKRAFDIAAAGTALVVLSPILALTALAVKLEDGGRPLFISHRVGRKGESFPFYKFRSMPMNTANVPSASARDLQVTRVGRFIRRTNIDELPQLFNIVKGDMSVVGPRPSIDSQEDLIRMRAANGALVCRPGLTGLAQVEAFDGMTNEQKAAYDGEYARNVTFWGDLGIIVRTLGYLLKPPPVY